MSYTVKLLRVTFTLTNSNAVFPGTNANQLVLSGLRMSASIIAGGLPSWPQATLRIWGMSQTDMQALAVQRITNGKTGYQPNDVLIEADSGNGWSAVFSGSVITAAANYRAAPEVSFDVVSQTGFYDALNPATPSSFPTSTGIADIFSVIVAKLGRNFINNGVSGTASGSAYFPQSLTDQLRTAAKKYNVDAVFSQDDRTVTITPRAGPTKACRLL